MSRSTIHQRPSDSESPTSGPKARALIRRSLRGSGGITAIGVLLTAWLLLAVDGFGSDFNRFSLGRTLAVTSLVGLSQMVVLGVGGLNLSVGAIGACVAALLIGLINNGIVLAKIDPYWEDLAIGIVVLTAVLVARGKGEAQARDVRIA